MCVDYIRVIACSRLMQSVICTCCGSSSTGCAGNEPETVATTQGASDTYIHTYTPGIRSMYSV